MSVGCLFLFFGQRKRSAVYLLHDPFRQHIKCDERKDSGVEAHLVCWVVQMHHHEVCDEANVPYLGKHSVHDRFPEVSEHKCSD